MPNIPFTVIAPRTRPLVLVAPAFVLEQDRWNDFNFQTQYHLSFYAATPSGIPEATLIGAVKILRKGQTKQDGLLVTSDFDHLGADFCSVGQSLDYYERMRELGIVGTQAMTALQDVVANPILVDLFKDEEGWRVSLFREHGDKGAQFLQLAKGLVNGDYELAPQDQRSFTFAPGEWQSSIEIDTRSGEVGPLLGTRASLPERMNVLVGRNGAGKSTLLARLARVAYASPSERRKSHVADLGKLTPEGVGFTRVITVSFSPFDSFRLPGSDDRNRIQIAKDMRRGKGRFIFLGLRDVDAEIEELESSDSLFVPGSLSSLDDRVAQTRLKSIEKLADEFIASMLKVFEQGRASLLREALIKLERGAFSYDWAALTGPESSEDVRQEFLLCSTGHKITLLVIVGLVAHMEAHALILFDEPETHLHPPLLSAMMHALRRVLEEFEATAVVATHSPVVVQESMARHVHVVRREGELNTVLPVASETFGESIGLITAQVFGLQTDATDFHRVLDVLITRYDSLEEIESLFKDGMMSNQARAYVLTRLAEVS